MKNFGSDEVVTNPTVSLQAEYFQHNKLTLHTFLHRNPESIRVKLDFVECKFQVARAGKYLRPRLQPHSMHLAHVARKT